MSEKDDLRQLAIEVRDLTGQVRDLTHQVSDSLKRHDDLMERAKSLEQFRDKAQPNLSFVNTVKLILVGGAVAIIGATVGGAFWLGSLASDVKHQGENMAAMRKDVDGLRDDLKQVPRVHSGKVAKADNGKVTFIFADGHEKTVLVAPDALIMKDGKRVTIADLGNGDGGDFTEVGGQLTKLDVKTPPHP
jgi:hypothetical protein